VNGKWWQSWASKSTAFPSTLSVIQIDLLTYLQLKSWSKHTTCRPTRVRVSGGDLRRADMYSHGGQVDGLSGPSKLCSHNRSSSHQTTNLYTQIKIILVAIITRISIWDGGYPLILRLHWSSQINSASYPQQDGKWAVTYRLKGEGLVWLIWVVVCLLTANHRSSCLLMWARDDHIMRCVIVSSCQSTASSETAKCFWSWVWLV